jgi:hypothetical protein
MPAAGGERARMRRRPILGHSHHLLSLHIMRAPAIPSAQIKGGGDTFYFIFHKSRPLDFFFRWLEGEKKKERREIFFKSARRYFYQGNFRGKK